MEIIEDNIGSGLELDPLSFIHMGGKKDIYEVSMIQKIGDNPMVIPYQLFKVAIEKVVGEQVAKAVTTALSRLGEIKKEKWTKNEQRILRTYLWVFKRRLWEFTDRMLETAGQDGRTFWDKDERF